MTYHIYVNNTGGAKRVSKHYELDLDACDDINIHGADMVTFTPTSTMTFVHAYYSGPVDVKIESTERGGNLGRYTEIDIRPKR